MEVLKSIVNLIKAHTMTRKVELPGDMAGYVHLNAVGDETIIVKENFERRTNFNAANMSDVVEFARALPERYGMDRAKDFRELFVHVDSNDVPVRVTLRDRLDKKEKAEIEFVYKDHRDFTRWMGAKNLTQLEFRALLLELHDQHDQPNLAGALSIIKYKTEIEYEASVETERNFKLAFSENEMQGSVEIPKIIVVNCPVISGTKHHQRIEFEVVIRKPKNSDEKIKFSLVPYGKDSLMIRKDAALEVTLAEFIGPVQAELNVFTTILPVMYVRREPEDLVYTATADLARISR